jgi:hypothetical protein
MHFNHYFAGHRVRARLVRARLGEPGPAEVARRKGSTASGAPSSLKSMSAAPGSRVIYAEAFSVTARSPSDSPLWPPPRTLPGDQPTGGLGSSSRNALTQACCLIGPRAGDRAGSSDWIRDAGPLAVAWREKAEPAGPIKSPSV